MKLSILVAGLLTAGFTFALPRDSEHAVRPSSLSKCLDKKNVPAKWHSSPEYADLAEPFNLRLQYKPAVIVLPKTSQHVQDAVVCASECGFKVQAKSGGHSYASFSSGGRDGSMMIDLQNFQNISLDKGSNIARVGGGVRLGNLAQGIWDQGKRGLPHGTCTGVGIGGHFTHGGYGHTSRRWGISLDTIKGLDVVLANGTLVYASSTTYPDIYWALRGAADSFGIIVNFYLQTEAAPKDITYFSYKWDNLYTDRQQYIDHFLHLQDFATNSSIVDDRISFGINTNGNTYNLGGTFFGPVSEMKEKIEPELLRTLTAPSSITVTSYDWIGYLTLMSDKASIKEPLTGYDEHDNFFAKSITVPEKNGLSAASLGAMFDTIKAGSPTPFFVITNLYGGPHSSINLPSKDTSFAAYKHRDSLWVMQLYGHKENAGDEAVPFINNLTHAITSAAPDTEFGAYLNYVDPSLSQEEAHRLYYGEELLRRLQDVKRAVDPKNVFWNPQGIEV